MCFVPLSTAIGIIWRSTAHAIRIDGARRVAASTITHVSAPQTPLPLWIRIIWAVAGGRAPAAPLSAVPLHLCRPAPLPRLQSLAPGPVRERGDDPARRGAPDPAAASAPGPSRLADGALPAGLCLLVQCRQRAEPLSPRSTPLDARGLVGLWPELSGHLWPSPYI